MKRILIMTLAAVLLSIIIDLSLHRGKGDFPWSSVPGFFALFGLVGCVALIVVSKWLSHRWLQRREDYYDRNDADE
ncbi:MAG: hypothetical protein V1737_05815 [Chloroflexota bacterium]